ncbi:glycosyltransferase [Achromobacter sp. NPDC008082]|uniref:CgeB family protein n=1 Tax=Achromobacter sp. NPDC008082 TaxID=3363888 RepID=UPI0036DFB8B0
MVYPAQSQSEEWSPLTTGRIYLVSDDLTADALKHDVDLIHLSPLNYRLKAYFKRADYLLVESAWQGQNNQWKYKIANYPDHPKRNNKILRNLVDFAKNCGIPTVFWNKEDGAHFSRFIDSAKLFDHIFTVDENCIDDYRRIVPTATTINTLMFAVQPSIHYPIPRGRPANRATFIGSYGKHIHDARRAWQDMVFQAATDVQYPILVVDRNSDRKNDTYRYPSLSNITVSQRVPYSETANIYRNNAISLNVNTVTDSKTMYSRRLVEILACGGIAVSNPAASVQALFKDYCHVIDSADQARELFSRFLIDGPSSLDIERAMSGAEYVARNHTWSHRLAQISEVIYG